MVTGMATTKLTITLEDDQLEEIREFVANGNAPSVSAFVKHAVGVALHDAAGWKEMLKSALAETGGPLTKKERAWADGVLSPRRKGGRGLGGNLKLDESYISNPKSEISDWTGPKRQKAPEPMLRKFNFRHPDLVEFRAIQL